MNILAYGSPEGWAFVFALIIVTILAHIFMYDRLNSQRNELRGAFNRVQAQLENRYGYLPGLLASLEGIAEPELLAELSGLRARAENPKTSPQERIQLDNRITQAMRRLLKALDAGSPLAGSEELAHLFSRLDGAEESFAECRAEYNQAARCYNRSVTQYPTKTLAGLFRFKTWDMLDTQAPCSQTLRGAQTATAQAAPVRPAGQTA